VSRSLFSQYLRRVLPLLAAACAAAGCEKVGDRPTERVLAADETEEMDYELIGVDPTQFSCASVAPLSDVEIAVASKLKEVDAHMPMPAGVAQPCSYRAKLPPYPQWSFDLDCRPAAIKTGHNLMVRFSGEPGAVPVRVGRSGIDHRDAVLLWIEDDAPCYGRAMGPEQAKRLAIASLVSANLTERNAPSSVVIRSKK
jgi:hypothetical protein